MFWGMFVAPGAAFTASGMVIAPMPRIADLINLRLFIVLLYSFCALHTTVCISSGLGCINACYAS